MNMSAVMQTPFGCVSKKVYDELRKAGWSSDRNESAALVSFSNAWKSQWVPAANPFIENFSGLSFHGRLWVWDSPIRDHDIIALIEKISNVVGSKAIPVATSNYIGDGCVVWVDERGHYYAVDSEGMIYIAGDMAMALEVLLGDTLLPEPPSELKEKLIDAYEWYRE
jgi:hypothetical protein